MVFLAFCSSAFKSTSASVSPSSQFHLDLKSDKAFKNNDH